MFSLKFSTTVIGIISWARVLSTAHSLKTSHFFCDHIQMFTHVPISNKNILHWSWKRCNETDIQIIFKPLVIALTSLGLNMVLYFLIFYRFWQQRCEFWSLGCLHNHFVLIQQNQAPANGQTCHDHAALPDH